MPSRILLCLNSLDIHRGGIASVNRNILRALRAIGEEVGGVEVHAVVYHDAHGAPDPANDPIRFVFLGCGSSRRRFLAQYASQALAWRPHLIFIDHLHLAVVPHLARFLCPAPRVLFCHGIEFDSGISPLRRRAFQAARLRLSNSQFTARRLMANFPGCPVEPCELGIEELPTEETTDGPVRLPDAFGRQRELKEHGILIVARLSAAERYKGHDQLITLIPTLRESVPQVQLIVAGEGDDLNRLKALARERGSGEAVLFTGFAAPELLTALFARCRMFAMPSRGEGFGLVYLEAMRFAKPCVASRVDGGMEVVDDGVTGLHVDPDDPDELRAAILRLMHDDRLAARLGRAGREKLDRCYRFEHFRHRLQARLAEVLPALRPRREPLPLEAAR